MQPIDYTSAFGQNPMGGFVNALQAGQQFGLVEQRRQAAAQQQQMLQQQQQAASLRQQQIDQATGRLMAKPNRTFQDYEEVAALLPKEAADSLRANFEALTKEQQRNKLQSGAQVWSAVKSGQTDVALKLLGDYAEGERNAGREDVANAYETWSTLIKANPSGAELVIGGEIAALPGGKDFIESAGKIQEQRRQEALSPFTLRKETADAIIKEAEAKFAPEKVAAGLSLTNAQIEQAKAARTASLAAAAASGAEKKRKEEDAARLAAGIIPIEQRPKIETDFRKEYTAQTAGYRDVKSAYGRVLASQDNAVGDLSLIFGYMKMLDPGSVVREGEFATAQNAAGVPDRVLNIYNRVISGERLNESQRKAFKGQAEGLFKQAGQQENAVRKGMERIAKGYGLNTSNIFIEPTESAPTAPEMGGTPMPAGDVRSRADAIIRGGQ
jgi:hypothetical protein